MSAANGGLAEWSKAADLKSVRAQALRGSNPLPSAKIKHGISFVEVPCFSSRRRTLVGYFYIFIENRYL